MIGDHPGEMDESWTKQAQIALPWKFNTTFNQPVNPSMRRFDGGQRTLVFPVLSQIRLASSDTVQTAKPITDDASLYMTIPVLDKCS